MKITLGWSIENPDKRRHLLLADDRDGLSFTACGVKHHGGSVTVDLAHNGYGASCVPCKRCLAISKTKMELA